MKEPTIRLTHLPGTFVPAPRRPLDVRIRSRVLDTLRAVVTGSVVLVEALILLAVVAGFVCVALLILGEWR